jgi:hypothetical protein
VKANEVAKKMQVKFIQVSKKKQEVRGTKINVCTNSVKDERETKKKKKKKK